MKFFKNQIKFKKIKKLNLFKKKKKNINSL